MYIKVKTGGSRTLDRVYAQSKIYYKHLRYGMSFLEYYNSEDEEVLDKIELVRKGLMRVFELKIDFLLQDLDCLLEKGKIISQKDYNIRSYIIGEALAILENPSISGNSSETGVSQSLDRLKICDSEVQKQNTSCGVSIEICHYVQTDGINAQISYCPNLS
mmetsp:Transcript_25241/g.29111  ORF Transcript_25241/g.29111 Transcript_25241/m.29111 type:complete len:161 (-) Transcript_25241:1157-1639(-)